MKLYVIYADFFTHLGALVHLEAQRAGTEVAPDGGGLAPGGGEEGAAQRRERGQAHHAGLQPPGGDGSAAGQQDGSEDAVDGDHAAVVPEDGATIRPPVQQWVERSQEPRPRQAVGAVGVRQVDQPARERHQLGADGAERGRVRG